MDLHDLEEEVRGHRTRLHLLEQQVTRLLFQADEDRNQTQPRIHWLERLAWMALGALGLIGWLRKP